MWTIHYPLLFEAIRYLKNPYHILVLDQLARNIYPIGYEGNVDKTFVSYKKTCYKYSVNCPKTIAENLSQLWVDLNVTPLGHIVPFTSTIELPSPSKVKRKEPLKKLNRPEMKVEIMFYRYARQKRWKLTTLKKYRIQMALKLATIAFSPGLTSILSIHLKKW